MGITVDWKVVGNAVWALAMLFAGAWINRRYERRARLISYYGHVSAFKTTPPGGTPIQVNAHSVIVQNAGRKVATNVRLRHKYLPDFVISPGIQHSIDQLPSNERDIVIPSLIPKEQITVSYLYFPPITYEQIHAGIRSDEGFAEAIPVLLQRQYPRWIIVCLQILIALGAITVLYFAIHLVRLFLR